MRLSKYIETAITDAETLNKPLDKHHLLSVYAQWLALANDLESGLDKIHAHVVEESAFHFDVWQRAGGGDISNPYHHGSHCAMQDMGEWLRENFNQLNTAPK